MAGPPRITAAQRRARLGARHLLAPGAGAATPDGAARAVVAVHGSDPSSVYLGLLARMAPGAGLADVEQALYEDRTLLRLLAMRRTVFVTPLDTAAVLQAACSADVAARERRKMLGWLADGSVDAGPGPGEDHEAWLAAAEQAALTALAARGIATPADLAGDDPRLAAQLVLGRGTRLEGRQSIASRMLFLLAAHGHAVRTRPRGGWTSSQYRWSPLTLWCPDGLREWAAADAAAELARRWLAAYGPATTDDLRWWTGWTVTQLKQALTRVRPAEVDLDGVPGIALPGDLDPVPEPGPWAALLPGLDSTPMGWQRREWFLGEHGPRVFDTTGNVGPTLWWNGRVVGGWATDQSGQVVIRFLEDAGAEAAAAAQTAAARLTEVLAGARLAPRARRATPLEAELAARR